MIKKTISFIFLLLCTVAISFSQTNKNSVSYFIWFSNTSINADSVISKVLLDAKIKYPIKIEKSFKINEEPFNRIWEIRDILEDDTLQLCAFIKSTPFIEFYEQIPEYKLFYTPNDLSSNQWNLKKIEAEKAWNISKGGKNIIVGLIDDGLDTAHEDIQPVLWHNKNEIKGNGIDDDGNGYVDDFFGWDVADNDNSPHVIPSDNLDHGTHCGGIIGAKSDNSKGISSIGFNVKIMPIKTGKKGIPWLFDPYKGVEYAISNGAQVISMSWGGGSYSVTYQAIFNLAYKKGIVCVAAAGNSSTSTVMYPAGYNYVISVGSTTSSDAASSFTNYGKWIDVMAPGSAIYSTLPGNNYGYMSGTSMACPLVSGLCALMLSQNTLMSNTDVETCLKNGCENIDSKNASLVGLMGAGRINAFKSMSCVKPVFADFTSNKIRVCNNDSVRFTDKSSKNATSWKWSFPGGSPSNSTAPNPIIQYSTSGSYNVELIVSDGTYSDTIVKSNFISVGKPTAIISGNQSIQNGDFSTARIDMTAYGPWDFAITNGKDTFIYTNVKSTPYFALLQPSSTTTYTLLSIKEDGCIGAVSGSSKATVTPGGICDSSLRFQVHIGGSGDDQGLKMHFSNDSTIIIAGKSSSYGAGNYDGFIASVKTDGQVNWLRTMGGTSEDGLLTCSVDKDGNIYAGGYTYSGVGSRGAGMYKFDKNGTLKWRKIFTGGLNDYIYEIVQSRHKKYIYFIGLYISNSIGSEDFGVTKLDTSGNIIWSKQFGNDDLNRSLVAFEDKNLNLHIGGQTGNPFPIRQALLLKIDSAGKILLSRRIDPKTGTYNTIIQKISAWGNDSLVVAAFIGEFISGNYTTREYMIFKCDLNYNIAWTKKYIVGAGYINDMTISNKKIIIAGFTDSKGTDGFLLQTDSLGNVLKCVLAQSNNYETINCLLPEENGGVYIIGTKNISGSNQILFGRTSCNLDLYCQTAKVTPSVSSIILTSNSYAFTSKNFSPAVNPTFSYNKYNPNSSIICKSNYKSKPKCKLNASFKIQKACTGDTVVLSSTSTDSLYSMNYWNWKYKDGTISGTPIAKIVYSKNTIDTIRLIVKSSLSNSSCSDTAYAIYSSADSFFIKHMPNDTLVCVGDSFALQAPVPACGEWPFTYKWSPKIDLDNDNIASPFIKPTKNRTYTVIITDFFGKTAMDSVKITVNPTCCKSKARLALNKESYCPGDTIILKNTSTHKKNAVFKWWLNGAVSAQYNSIEPPPIVVQKSGNLSISLVLKDSCGIDSTITRIFIYPVNKISAGNDTSLCLPDTIQLGSIPVGRNVYQWSPATGLNNANTAQPIAKITSPINYVLTTLSEFGCIWNDTIKITSSQSIGPFLGNDTSICSLTGLYTLTVSNVGNAPLLWDNASTSPNRTIQNSGIYWCEISKGNCKFTDSIKVQLELIPTFSLGKDTTICTANLPFVLKPKNLINSNNLTYAWEDASNKPTRSILTHGLFYLNITNGNCQFADSILIDTMSNPIFKLPNDTNICSGDTVFISVQPRFKTQYVWNTGSTNTSIQIKNKGIYTLEAKNACGTYRDEINITLKKCDCPVYIPNSFSPNFSEGINDLFYIQTICPIDLYQMQILNRWGEVIYSSDDISKGWDGNYNGKLVPSGVYMCIVKIRSKYINQGYVFYKTATIHVLR